MHNIRISAPTSKLWRVYSLSFVRCPSTAIQKKERRLCLFLPANSLPALSMLSVLQILGLSSKKTPLEVADEPCSEIFHFLCRDDLDICEMVSGRWKRVIRLHESKLSLRRIEAVFLVGVQQAVTGQVDKGRDISGLPSATCAHRQSECVAPIYFHFPSRALQRAAIVQTECTAIS